MRVNRSAGMQNIFVHLKKKSTVRDELSFNRTFHPFSLSFAQHYHILSVHLVPLGGCEQHLMGRRTMLPKFLLRHHIQSEPLDDKRPVVNVATGTMFAVSALQMIQTETMKYKRHLSICCHCIVMEGFHNLDFIIKYN